MVLCKLHRRKVVRKLKPSLLEGKWVYGLWCPVGHWIDKKI